MKKELKPAPYLAPMPVLMIATYGEDGTVDVMNMAWGGVVANDLVELNIGEAHATSRNIAARKAFTLAVADVAHAKEADFFGIASANTMGDKFARSGLTAVRSEKVDAPVIEEFPVTLECEVVFDGESEGHHRVVGKVVGILADEDVLGDDGKPDYEKVQPLTFDQFHNAYFGVGERVGAAWGVGRELMHKA